MEPDMQILDQFSILNTQSSLRLDSSASATPLTRDVSSPSEIMSVFDHVIYSKAASVIRMMEDVLTPPAFLHGNSLYLTPYVY